MSARFRPLAILFLFLAFCAGPTLAGSVLGDDYNDDEDHDYNGMPAWRITLETGYSQWIYNPDRLYPAYERYINTLETGWDYSSQVAYFPWAKGGIGVNWIWFLSKSQRNGVHVDSTGIPYNLRDRVSMVYWGPVFLSRQQFGRFGLLVGGFGAGMLQLHYGWTANGRRALVEAKTVAVVPEVGWEYSFYRLVSLGVNARAVIADLQSYTYNGKKVTLKQPDDPHYWSSIGLTRFELNAGIRFGL